MDLVPLKVTIGLKVERKRRLHAYPDFNQIPEGKRDSMDWSHFVDQYGGWHYDHVAGHDEEDIESPRGTWVGMLLVPEDFANEAASRWPDQCKILNAQQAERFYEVRVTLNHPEIIEDLDTLQIIAAKRQAGIPESDEDRAALDPENPRRGRTKNKRKKFADMLLHRGLKLKGNT